MPELNGRQRLELAMLCEDYERGAGDLQIEQLPEIVAIVRYIEQELLDWDDFNEGDRRSFFPVYIAMRMLNRLSSWEPGSFEHTVLAYAGFIHVDGIEPSDLDPDQAVPIEVRERLDTLADLIGIANPDEPSSPA